MAIPRSGMIPIKDSRTELTPRQKPANAYGLLFFSAIDPTATLVGADEVLSAAPTRVCRFAAGAFDPIENEG